MQFRLKLDLNRPPGRDTGKMFDHIGPVIEIFVSGEGVWEQLYVAHAIQSKRAISLSQTTVADHIPVPFPPDDSIWLDLSLSELVMVRTVLDSDSSALLDGLAEFDQERGINPLILRVRDEDHM